MGECEPNSWFPFAWAFGWPVLRLRLCANDEHKSLKAGSENVKKGPRWSEDLLDPFLPEVVLCSVG